LLIVTGITIEPRAMNALQWVSLSAGLLVATATSGRAQTVTELYVSPDTLTLKVGEKQGLTVQAFDNNGNAILRMNFRSTDDAVVVVEGTGTVTGVAVGRSQIVVTAGRKTKSVYVVVEDPGRTSSAAATPYVPTARTFSSVIIEPAAIFALPGERVLAVAAGLREDGGNVGRLKATWKSIRPDVATVGDTSGIVIGVAPGQGVLQAVTPNGLAATVPVFVSNDEFFLQVNALALSVHDSFYISTVVPKQQTRHLPNTQLQWASTNLAIAQVSTDGMVQGIARGQAEIIVRGFGQERRLPVNVYPEIATFLTSPRLADTVGVPQLGTREFKIRAEAADSTPIPDVPIVWILSDTSIAGFDRASGLLTGKKIGTTTLSFAARGFAPLGWTVQVVAATLGLDRPKVALAPGQKTRLQASYLGENGKPSGVAAGVTWTSNNPGVARIGADGSVEAVAPGRAMLSAAVGAGEPVSALVLVSGDLLLVSSRLGKLGIFSLAGPAHDLFIPVVADTFSNSVDPAYSPDRTRLAFSSDRMGSGNYDIYVADADGRNPLRLTTDPALDAQPVWTPDGQEIVFTSTQNSNRRIMAMKVDGTDLRLLATLAGGVQDPAVSPDGSVVAFTAFPGTRDGQTDIYSVPLKGGPATAVIASRDHREHSPAYLPNGDLVYVVDRKDKKEMNLVLRRTNTTLPTPPLISSDDPVTRIAIAPGGDRIAWTTARMLDRNRTETALLWRPLLNGAETVVPLLPGERVSSPVF
jgi:uncharacterized protein YjdB